MTTFQDLGLAEELLKALADEEYVTPTPIQLKAIPVVLTGADLLGIAQTGTGKTAAFALPILHRLAAERRQPPRRGCRVLVLSPTRELATQIADSFRAYGRHLGVSVAVVFGGIGHRPQIHAMARGVDILVATPGRLLDHMDERHIVLDGTEVFVLDEADQMLDLGFVKPIRRIVAKLSARRQSLFFSATMPPEIGALAAELLTNPQKVSVAPTATTVERVVQRVIHVEQSKKRSLLVELFADPAMTRTLVFTRTKRGADRVAAHLEAAGVTVAAIHGNKSQGQRERALDQFRCAEIRVLVATDIAARGLDIPEVTHVINYEMPDVPESYVHRIGRTARAGASGMAISLVDGEERGNLREIERITRQTIAAEDRRGDAGLIADPKGSARGGRDRGERNDRTRQRVTGPRNGSHSDHRRGDQHRDGRHDEGRRSAGSRSGEAGRSQGPAGRDGDARSGRGRPERRSDQRNGAPRRDHQHDGHRPKPQGERRHGSRSDEAPRRERQPERAGQQAEHRGERQGNGHGQRRPEHRGNDRSTPGGGEKLAGMGFMRDRGHRGLRPDGGSRSQRRLENLDRDESAR